METAKATESQAVTAASQNKCDDTKPPSKLTRRERLQLNPPPSVFPSTSVRPPLDKRLTDEIMLECRVRVWSRDREIFIQERILPIWKGATQNGLDRYAAAQDISGQLRQVFSNVQSAMQEYVNEVDRTPLPQKTMPLPQPSEDHFQVMPLNPDFTPSNGTAQLPPPE